MDDNDTPGYLGAAFFLAQEQQRQANTEAADANARSRELAQQASDLDHQLQRQTQQSKEVEDDYWALFNLLKQPMHVIAQRNQFFAQTYQESRKELAMGLVREMAYKELAIQLGSKIGMSPESVQRKAETMRADVLQNRFPEHHGTNANTTPLLKEMGDSLLQEWAAQRKAFLEEYSRALRRGDIYDLIGGAPDSWSHVFRAASDLVATGKREAQLVLGYCYLYEKGARQNTDEAERMYLAAKNAGEPKAPRLLHYLYKWTGSNRFSEQKAEDYLALAEQLGDPQAVPARKKWNEERQAMRWKQEEQPLFEKLSVVTPGQRPPELDTIKGRGYAWEEAANMFHASQYRIVRAHTVNKGTFFSPNRFVQCFVEVTNPTDFRSKVWARLEWNSDKYGKRPRESEGTSSYLEKNGTAKLTLGQYSPGVSSDFVVIALEKYSFKIQLPKPFKV